MPLFTAVITMQPIKTIFKKITSDFAHIRFASADTFYWSPSTSTIYYSEIKNNEGIWNLIHEISHAALGHASFNSDIELLQCEAQAWEYADTTLSPKYGITIDYNFMQEQLDTYRTWLNKRSLCPNCRQNGIQTQNTYRCINCRCSWRANEARNCTLKRFRLTR